MIFEGSTVGMGWFVVVECFFDSSILIVVCRARHLFAFCVNCFIVQICTMDAVVDIDIGRKEMEDYSAYV